MRPPAGPRSTRPTAACCDFCRVPYFFTSSRPIMAEPSSVPVAEVKQEAAVGGGYAAVWEGSGAKWREACRSNASILARHTPSRSPSPRGRSRSRSRSPLPRKRSPYSRSRSRSGSPPRRRRSRTPPRRRRFVYFIFFLPAKTLKKIIFFFHSSRTPPRYRSRSRSPPRRRDNEPLVRSAYCQRGEEN